MQRLNSVNPEVAQARAKKVTQMAYLLRTENKNAANADGSMSKEEQRDYRRRYEAELVSPEEVALRARGASNAGEPNCL